MTSPLHGQLLGCNNMLGKQNKLVILAGAGFNLLYMCSYSGSLVILVSNIPTVKAYKTKSNHRRKPPFNKPEVTYMPSQAHMYTLGCTYLLWDPFLNPLCGFQIVQESLAIGVG
ncbi:hypothetical protein SUGI_0485660 [Cryptomeria japonica]|nr:hypothetical protein SUGI_0485660 [Cryptomeria japonica]